MALPATHTETKTNAQGEGWAGAAAGEKQYPTFQLTPEEDARAETIIKKCLSFKFDRSDDLEVETDEAEALWLMAKSELAMLSQPSLLRLRAPIRIVGDIHGQYVDLLRAFELGGYPPNESYLFLGDYIDRGRNGIECMMLLLALKVRFPNHIFLLRGNHESESINRVYGFFAECKRRLTMKCWEACNAVFATMPIAAVIEEKVFCIHGGLSPLLEDLSQIENLRRPLQIPPRGMLIDFLWSDPDADVRGWAESDRGISYNFGADVLKSFLRKYKFDLMVRAHQVVEAGYELFADRQLVTLFSAPNYCGEFDNAGAIMVVESDLRCRFLIIAPRLKNGFHYSYDGRPKTPVFD